MTSVQKFFWAPRLVGPFFRNPYIVLLNRRMTTGENETLTAHTNENSKKSPSNLRGYSTLTTILDPAPVPSTYVKFLYANISHSLDSISTNEFADV
jgi:hypothetical protein